MQSSEAAIEAGDRVVMWVMRIRSQILMLLSSAFSRPRTHLAFGFGVHRRVGNRLAEM
jgi:cytochrome P450